MVSVDPAPFTPPYQIIRLWNSTLLKERGDTPCLHASLARWAGFFFLSFVHILSLGNMEILEFSQSFACLKNFLTYSSRYQIKSFLFYYKYMWESFKYMANNILNVERSFAFSFIREHCKVIRKYFLSHW